mgnify:CR=1 FL=1
MSTRQIVFIIAMVTVVLLIFQLSRKQNDTSIENEQVIPESREITLEDVKINYSNVRFEDRKVEGYFTKDIINSYTIKFFKHLQQKYKDMPLEKHLETVRKYLLSIMNKDRAESIFALYKKFTMYEIKLADEMKNWENPGSTTEMLRYLRNLQDFRRQYFGDEVADLLFGPQVKSQEYQIRRSAIVRNDDLYGAEKEKKLQELNSQMWDNTGDAITSMQEPYEQYQEKLEIYQKDLGELSGPEKEQKIDDFRREFFTPETIERLEKVDQQLAAEKQTEEKYRQAEQKVMSDPNLTASEKDDRIRELQKEYFGEQAEAFRRREAIKEGSRQFQQ